MATSPTPPAEAFRPELVAHARRVLGRRRDGAEDVVQEAFVHLLRRGREGNPPLDARPWLYAVVSSLCIREQGRGRREQPAEIEILAASSADPAELAQIRAEMRWALASVAALPARERATLIADLAGVAQGHDGANARYQALHRARRKLRALRAEAWALVPLPLLRWSKLFGAEQAGIATGGGMAPGTLAAGGIAKGAIVAASAVLALAGGQVVDSIRTADAPPLARAELGGPIPSADSGAGPGPAQARPMSQGERLVVGRTSRPASPTADTGASAAVAPGPASPAPQAAVPSAAAPLANPAPTQGSEPADPSRGDASDAVGGVEDGGDAPDAAAPGEDLEDEIDAPAEGGGASDAGEPGGDGADEVDASAPGE